MIRTFQVENEWDEMVVRKEEEGSGERKMRGAGMGRKSRGKKEKQGKED